MAYTRRRAACLTLNCSLSAAKKDIAGFQEAGYFLYGTGSEIEFHAASRWHVFNFHSPACSRSSAVAILQSLIGQMALETWERLLCLRVKFSQGFCVFDNIMEWYLPLRLRDEIHVTHTGEQSSRRHISIYSFFFFSFLVPACEYQVSPGRSKSLSPCVETRPLTLSRVCLGEERVHFYNNAPDDLPNRECMHFILSLREAHVFLQTTSLIFHLYRARSPSILIYFTAENLWLPSVIKILTNLTALLLY
jgi:hypothetical protein